MLRRRTRVRRWTGPLRCLMGRLPRWRHFMLLRRPAFVRPVRVSPAVIASLVVVVILAGPPISRIVLCRRGERAELVIGPCSIVIAVVPGVHPVAISAVHCTRVHPRLFWRHGGRMIFAARCPGRNRSTAAEVARPRGGGDRRTPVILRREVLPVPYGRALVLPLNVEGRCAVLVRTLPLARKPGPAPPLPPLNSSSMLRTTVRL